MYSLTRSYTECWPTRSGSCMLHGQTDQKKSAYYTCRQSIAHSQMPTRKFQQRYILPLHYVLVFIQLGSMIKIMVA